MRWIGLGVFRMITLAPSSSALLRASIAAFVALTFGSSTAWAQLKPDRLYYGVNRPVPMAVSIPEGVTGEAEIHLLKPVSAELIEKAPASKGPVDLAALFPKLWAAEQTPALAYAQLVVGGKKIGPAVVLQPMTSPPLAWIPDQRNRRDVRWVDNQKVYSGLRAYVEHDVVMKTTLGEIRFALRPDQAPNTSFNFRHLVEGGFYTDIDFHRIIGTSPQGFGFVIQAGDPLGQGVGGPGYAINLEPSKLSHDFGVLSMAREGDPNTNGSQFFICLSREGTAGLDNLYTAFGYAISGADVIQKIAAIPVKADGSTPKNPPKIEKAMLVDAAPYGEGSKAVMASAATGTPAMATPAQPK
jgi:peptidyl-prolyl cis-trans isomerase B (cyclophilin B)